MSDTTAPQGWCIAFGFVNDIALNASQRHAGRSMSSSTGKWALPGPHFSWVTDLHVTKGNVYRLMRGGRARWKIENETFNTLKNQGYHFEHNYGHGTQNLSVVFALLMMLAFLVDQTQQLCCALFRKRSGRSWAANACSGKRE